MSSIFSGQGPLFSIILTILAGIALRYALWYGKEEQYVDDSELSSLRERNRSLREALEAEQEQREKTDHDNAKALEDYDSLRAALDGRDNTIYEARQSTAELELELGKLRDQAGQLQAENERLSAGQSEGGEVLERLRSENTELATTIDQMRTEVSDAAASSEQLRSENEEISTKYELLRSDLVSKDQIASDQSESLAIELAELREAMLVSEQAGEESLRAERERSESLQGELAALTETLSQTQDQVELLQSEARFAENLRHEQGQLKHSLHASAERMRSIHSEHEAMTSKVAESNSRIVQLQDTIDGQNRRIQQYASEMASLGERADQQVVELRESYEQQVGELRGSHEQQVSQLREQVGQLQESRTQQIENLNEISTQQLSELKESYEQELNELKGNYGQQVHELQQTYEEKITILESHISDSSNRTQTMESTLEEHATRVTALTTQITELSADRDDLANQLSTTREQLNRYEAKIEDYETVHASHNDNLRAANTEKQELLNGLHREQETRIRLENLLADLEQRTSGYQTLSVEVTSLRDRCSGLDQRLVDATEQAARYESERDDINASLIHAQRRVAELGGSVSRFEQDLAGRESLIRKLSMEKENVVTQLERERSERNRLENMLRIHMETLEQLRVDSQSLESLLERQTIVQQSLQEHAERLRNVTGVKSESPIVADPQILSMVSDTESEQQTDSVHRTIFGDRRDDLKEISGIGEVLEQKLNDLGVKTYDQVMSWGDDDIEEYSKLLAWDRIEADDWVGQARQLFEHAIRSKLRAA